MERNDYPERDEFSEIPPQEPDSVDFQADFPEPTYHDWQQDYPAEEPAAPEAPFDLSIPDGQESDEPQPEMPEESPVSPAEDISEQVAQPSEELVPDPEFQDIFGDGTELDQILDTPSAPEPEHRERPVRKGRPKRKGGEFLFGLPQIAVTCVWLAIILVAGSTLGRMLWVCAADVLAFGREDKPVTITIYESDTMDDIIEKLHKNGLIRYPGLFKLYADLAVDEGEIKPGIWDLNTLYDYHALVNMMSPSSNREVVENVLIPEGFTCRQIFALLEEKRVCTAKDLAEYAASGELDDYWFLEGVERGDKYCLEGFLFPDTYDFYKNSDPRDVLEKMLDNFSNRFNDDLRSQIDSLNYRISEAMRAEGKSEDQIARSLFTVRDVVITASLIEKETSGDDESPMISSVIFNRLFRWGGNPAYLNIDAAIVYALEGKTDLTAEDLRVDSPYNTYLHTGLTPGAISNPGLASLKAALNPADTNYFYYVLDPSTGSHKFSVTLDEHNAFIAALR